MINYYVVLEIPNFSDEAVIKKAYRTLSKKYHPDINKDPFATTYFLKINEAYDFLMDANKRMLLHQYLHAVANQASTKTNYTQSNLQKNRQYSPPVTKPLIHVFQVNKKHFAVNDLVLLQWNVSQCKAVHINVLGNVSFAGTHYLKMDHFADEIIILMTITGLDNTAYKYQIKLLYDNSNPAEKAFFKMLAKNPTTKQIHFKKESFFNSHARIGKNTFKNRMILLLLFLVINVFLYVNATAKHFMFVLLLFNFWVIYVQCSKRIHDIFELKNGEWKLWIPFYNLSIFYKLFILESDLNTNEFGIVPNQTNISFVKWIKKSIQKAIGSLSLLHKISMGSFFLLITCVIIKFSISYQEIDINLTSNYIETSRPTTNGRINKHYYLVFEKAISVEVSEMEYEDIVYDKKFDAFKMGINKNNEAQYIHLINKKTNKDKRLGFGVFSNANPIFIIIAIIFLGQIFASTNLKKPTELPYANAYMMFSVCIYLFTMYLLFK